MIYTDCPKCAGSGVAFGKRCDCDAAAPTQNFIFTSGAVDALPLLPEDRRFTSLPLDLNEIDEDDLVAVAAFALQQAKAAAIPHGWRPVPDEPTEAMLLAGCQSSVSAPWSYATCYRNMIAAAPLLGTTAQHSGCSPVTGQTQCEHSKHFFETDRNQHIERHSDHQGVAFALPAQPQTAFQAPALPEWLDISEEIALNSIDSIEFADLMGTHAAGPSMNTAWAVLKYADKRMHEIIARRFELAAIAAPAPTVAAPSDQAALPGDLYPQFNHPDDSAVDRFAAAMKAKMATQRAKGYSGWDNEVLCTDESLADKLMRHTQKGDPVDVANFCMMLHQRHNGDTFIVGDVLRIAALDFAKRVASVFVPEQDALAAPTGASQSAASIDEDDLKHSFRALLMDNTHLAPAKRDMLADALIIFVKANIERATPPAAMPAQGSMVPVDGDDVGEAVEILESLIENIKKDGNYSAEATLTFLGQVKQCLAAPAIPTQQLTDAEIIAISTECGKRYQSVMSMTWQAATEFARAIERHLSGQTGGVAR